MNTVDRVETFLVAPRWLFVRIEPSDGVVGWGEATCEGRSETVATAVGQLAELLIGADPSRIEDHHRTLSNGSFYRGGAILASAVAGIDQALWDIKGKTLGAPIHELLGGPVRDRVRVYAWVGGDEPDEVRDQIAERIEAGLTAVKMNASGRMNSLATSGEIDGVLARVGAAREVLGPDRDVAVDFHGRVSLPSAVRLAAELVPLRPMFIEEPVVPENSHRMGEVVRATSIPVATGERLFSRQEFLRRSRGGRHDRPARPRSRRRHHRGPQDRGARRDVRRAARPHCPLGPIGLAASLQIGFCTPSHVIQEQSIGIHYNVGAEVLDYLVDTSVFDYADGSVARLAGPGLGVEVDERAVRKAAAAWTGWSNPIWRYDDGGFAEW